MMTKRYHSLPLFLFILFVALALFGSICFYVYHIRNMSRSYSYSIIPVSMQQGFCQKNDIQAKVAFQGAAGTIYGDFTLKNISNHSCKIKGNSYIVPLFVNSLNNITIKHTAPPANVVYTVAPNNMLYARIHMPNGPQCNTGITQVNVIYKDKTANTSTVTFSDVNNNQQFTMNACTSASDITTISITPWSDQPITP